MKLSVAVKTGWKGVPHLVGDLQTWENGRITGACAIGAACYAADPTQQVVEVEQAFRLFPQLAETVLAPDEYGEMVLQPLIDVIIDISDTGPKPKAEIIAAIRELGY
jgi:hypothetical protein